MTDAPASDPVEALLEWLVRLARRPGVSDFTLGRTGLFAIRERRQWRRLNLDGPLDQIWDRLLARLCGSRAVGARNGLSVGVEFCGMRWRVTHTQAHRGPELTLRPLATAIPGAADLRLPDGLAERFSALECGLFIVAGATGAGKSTSIASLIVERAGRRGGKFVTLEDPIEHLYPDSLPACFSQREVGLHVESYEAGIIEAMHQGPDVIVVQEIRDRAGAAAALSAAMTGHLVVATVHAHAAHTVPQRLLGLLDGDGAGAAWREVLAATLAGVLVQQLHRGTCGGMTPVFEHLSCENEGLRLVSVERAVREADWKSLRQLIENGSAGGSFCLAGDLQRRRALGWVEPGP